MKWGLVIANRAKRHHRRLPLKEREHIDEMLFEMGRDPLSGDIKLLRGTRGTLRRRFGDWRVIFEIDREKRLVLIIDITRRGSHTY